MKDYWLLSLIALMLTSTSLGDQKRELECHQTAQYIEANKNDARDFETETNCSKKVQEIINCCHKGKSCYGATEKEKVEVEEPDESKIKSDIPLHENKDNPEKSKDSPKENTSADSTLKVAKKAQAKANYHRDLASICRNIYRRSYNALRNACPPDPDHGSEMYLETSSYLIDDIVRCNDLAHQQHQEHADASLASYSSQIGSKNLHEFKCPPFGQTCTLVERPGFGFSGHDSTKTGATIVENGSGNITEDGKITTADHVIEDCAETDSCKVKYFDPESGRYVEAEASVLSRDKDSDTAIMKLKDGQKLPSSPVKTALLDNSVDGCSTRGSNLVCSHEGFKSLVRESDGKMYSEAFPTEGYQMDGHVTSPPPPDKNYWDQLEFSDGHEVKLPDSKPGYSHINDDQMVVASGNVRIEDQPNGGFKIVTDTFGTGGTSGSGYFINHPEHGWVNLGVTSAADYVDGENDQYYKYGFWTSSDDGALVNGYGGGYSRYRRWEVERYAYPIPREVFDRIPAISNQRLLAGEQLIRALKAREAR